MSAPEVQFGPFKLALHGGRFGPAYVVKRRDRAGAWKRAAHGMTAQVVGMELATRVETRSRYNWELRRLQGFLQSLPHDPSDKAARSLISAKSEVETARLRSLAAARDAFVMRQASE